VNHGTVVRTNPDCNGSHCQQRTGEVRVLPTGGDGNVILCRACFDHEIRWRRERNRELGDFAQFKLPAWEACEVYGTAEETSMKTRKLPNMGTAARAVVTPKTTKHTTTDGFDLMKQEQLYDAHANANQMNREHAAWRQVCKHLVKLGVDINGQEPLACSIRLWGEELVSLREQNPKHTAAALREHRLAYASHVIRDGES